MANAGGSGCHNDDGVTVVLWHFEFVTGLGDYSMTSGVAKAGLFRQWQLIFGENLGGECNFGMTVRKYVVMCLRTECENTFFAHEHII